MLILEVLLLTSSDNVGNLYFNGATVSYDDIGSTDYKIKSITV